MNKVVALIGEDPNDTDSIKHLLVQKFSRHVSFKTLISRIRGSQLDSNKTQKVLEIEYGKMQPDVVVFIRDADCIATEQTKIDKRNNWYKMLSENIDCKKTLLLNIRELEALIFADIKTFNTIYKTNIKGGRDVTFIGDPKDELEVGTRNVRKKYSESDCPGLFKQLDIDVVIANCAYFRNFYTEFSAFVGATKTA